MEIIYANNIFILLLMFILFEIYFKNKIFLFLSLILLIIYIFNILNESFNNKNVDKPMIILNSIYSIVLIIFFIYFIRNNFNIFNF